MRESQQLNPREERLSGQGFALFENRFLGGAENPNEQQPWRREEAALSFAGLRVTAIPKEPSMTGNPFPVQAHEQWLSVQDLQMAQCFNLFAQVQEPEFEDQLTALPITTVELRFEKADGQLHCYVLARAAVPVINDSTLALQVAEHGVKRVIDLMGDHLPFGMQSEPLTGEELRELLERSGRYSEFGELVRPAKTVKFAEGEIQLPKPWEKGDGERLKVCRCLAEAEMGCVSFRLQPTRVAPEELVSLRKVAGFLAEKPSEAQLAESLLASLEPTRSAFAASVQLASNSSSMIRRLAYAVGTEDWCPTVEAALALPQRPKRVKAVTEGDRAVCAYNLNMMEFLPWGFVDQASAVASFPNSVIGFPVADLVPEESMLLNPRVRAGRLTNHVPHLARIRGLLSAREALALWKLPVHRFDAPAMGLPFS